MSIAKPSAPARKRRGSGPIVVPLTAIAVGAHLDEVHVVARGAEALLGDLDPALGGDHRRVHVVDRLVDAALEDAVQRGDGEQPRVVLGERAVRGDGDPLRPAALELDREPAELRGERDERPEHLEVGGVDDRDVDRVRDEAALERGDDLLGDDHARAVLRLVGRGGEVRRDDHLVELEQRAGVRLGGEDVERGAGELAGADRLGERLLVDERAAGGVDEARAVAHLRDRLRRR